ncbi:hypothetical protein RD792_017852 [Penstemon davidsonii]|uniref:GTD-binding domain-containing protein n=1 Tax=Penstemon davidsonii TaxID=160366 RepID=A0ABR0DWM3_9LAMI|nr:hypothetical protein RD792_017852 [Penstemon davidsonii]
MPPGSFKSFVEQKLGKFPHLLLYVILEWTMIILLFIDSFLAFISNQFAKLFQLRIPCLLCTRIDHVLAYRKSDSYYNDSICETHKKDISSLAYCHVHKKLSDIRNMCEGCLLSFATEKDSDCDKSLVGILHKDVDGLVEDDRKLLMKPLRKDDIEPSDEKSGTLISCSCCGEPTKYRSSVNYKWSLSMNAPTPSPRAPLLTSKYEVELPHIRYTELKFMSDTESEHPEDEVASNGDNQSKEDVNEDTCRTPSFTRGNRFFGIPLSSSAQSSPRWINRGNRKLPIDKLDLTLDPSDINVSNELDGDNLNRLKKQAHLDQKSLVALYMELDEERSASAVAANNAMAMITRLQAEKAAVQMEALQYQRMMEEQAEYDQEALQVMKDKLLKKDEDVKALESELEIYREKYGHIKNLGSEICEADEDYQDMRSQSSYCDSLSEADHNENDSSYERSMEYGGVNLEESMLDFDGERSFLLSRLTGLEEKLHFPLDEGLDSSEFGGTLVERDNRATLTREVSLIRERLRSVEADSGFLKHVAETLQRGGEGANLLSEIAQHLRRLRHSVNSPEEDTNAI